MTNHISIGHVSNEGIDLILSNSGMSDLVANVEWEDALRLACNLLSHIQDHMRQQTIKVQKEYIAKLLEEREPHD